MQRAGAVGSERPAAARLPLVSGAWLSLPPSSPHPESRCIGTCGGEGAGEGREGGLGEVPPSVLRLPTREESTFPSPAPGKVPGRSLCPAPSAKWLKGEGSPRGKEEGCVCGGEGLLSLGAGPEGVTYNMGGARTGALPPASKMAGRRKVWAELAGGKVSEPCGTLVCS